MFTPVILYVFVVASREFHLVHRDLGIPVSSWVAIEPNGIRLPSTLNPPKLGAKLPSPRRIPHQKRLT